MLLNRLLAPGSECASYSAEGRFRSAPSGSRRRPQETLRRPIFIRTPIGDFRIVQYAQGPQGPFQKAYVGL